MYISFEQRSRSKVLILLLFLVSQEIHILAPWL